MLRALLVYMYSVLVLCRVERLKQLGKNALIGLVEVEVEVAAYCIRIYYICICICISSGEKRRGGDEERNDRA